MLLVSTLLVLAAFGATAPDTSPSSLRLTVAAIVGLLAPLFWPGLAATPARTALRIVAWSAAAAGLAALVTRLLGGPAQTLPRLLSSSAMLMAVLLLAHAAAAALEGWWRGRSADAGQAGGRQGDAAHEAAPRTAPQEAREAAGRAVVLTLALLGALPLWLGPVAELLSQRHPGLVDAVLGASPLTHLAVASENDLLRNEWLYQHANLASLQANDPAPADLAWAYASIGLALVLASLALGRRRRTARDTAIDPAPHSSTSENTPS